MFNLNQRSNKKSRDVRRSELRKKSKTNSAVSYEKLEPRQMLHGGDFFPANSVNAGTFRGGNPAPHDFLIETVSAPLSNVANGETATVTVTGRITDQGNFHGLAGLSITSNMGGSSVLTQPSSNRIDFTLTISSIPAGIYNLTYTAIRAGFPVASVANTTTRILVNTIPRAGTTAFSTNVNETITGQLDGTDADNTVGTTNDTLTYSLVTGPNPGDVTNSTTALSNGTIRISTGGAFTYNPTTDNGDNTSFTYQVFDGHTFVRKTVNVTVVDTPTIEFDDDVNFDVGTFGLTATEQAFTNDNQPVFKGTADVGSMVTLTVHGATVGPFVTTADQITGIWQIPVSAADAIPDGDYEIQVSSDTGGVTGRLKLLVDTSKPTIPAALQLGTDTRTPILNNGEPAHRVNWASDGVSFNVDQLKFQSSVENEVVTSGVNRYQILINGQPYVNVPEISNSASTQTFELLANFPAIVEGTNLVHLRAIDAAGNFSGHSQPFWIEYDKTAPELVGSFETHAGAEKSLKVELNASQDKSSILPIAVTSEQRPKINLTFNDQQFRVRHNQLTVRLYAKDNSGPNLNLKTPLIFSSNSLAAPADRVLFGSHSKIANRELTIQPVTPLAANTDHTLIVEVTDRAGNTTTEEITFHVSTLGAPTPLAPGTPVETNLFYLGAELIATADKDQKIVHVNQSLPDDFDIRIDSNSYTIKTSTKLGENNYRLELTENLKADAMQGTRVALGNGLQPWQMSFDKSTQTVWFSLQDGNSLGQFDPATGHTKIYDVSMNGDPSAKKPHGVFFDFNSHLTPRVWFVTRANKTQPVRVNYFDVEQTKLFSFSFAQFTSSPSLGNNTLKEGHAVFVDPLGDVWLTTHQGGTANRGALVQLRFDRDVSLGNNTGKAIVHELLNESTDNPIEFHGVQVVVDERDGSQYVYFLDGNESSDRLANKPNQVLGLLRPADPSDGNSVDQWFTWTVPFTDKAFSATVTDASTTITGLSGIANLKPGLTVISNTAGVSVPDNTTIVSITNNKIVLSKPISGNGVATFTAKYASAHMLFTAIDDNETPGIPEDDKVIITDPGFTHTAIGKGGYTQVEVGNVIRAIQQGTELPASSTAKHMIVSSIPGVGTIAAGGNQSFVDRSGTVFSVDTQGSAIRFHFDDAFDVVSTIASVEQLESTKPARGPIGLEPVLLFNPAPVIIESILNSVLTNAPQDLSSNDGVDQYEVGTDPVRSGGYGPFRGALNATNVLYGSIAQSDHISTTVFAETARRQLAVVKSPLTPTGQLEGRMAFQVLRDGSLRLTGRADGQILDAQINLSKLTAGSDLVLPKVSVYGEVSAVVDNQHRVHVVGKQKFNGAVRIVVFTYSGSWSKQSDLGKRSNWTVKQLYGGSDLLVGDPTTYYDEQVNKVRTLVTTNTGKLLLFEADRTTPVALGQGFRGADGKQIPVYSGVGIVHQGNWTFAYGTNQSGNLIEIGFKRDLTASYTAVIEAKNVARHEGQTDRDLRVFQDVEVTLIGSTRHVYATDGNSRLVHYSIDRIRNVVWAENVSKKINAQTNQSNVEATGYFPFQADFVGRVYSGLEVLKDSTNTQFVYGTNGGELILFTKKIGKNWRVANLTNDVFSPFDDNNSFTRVPGNNVFGSPGGYAEANGDRHLFQINKEGEVIEYYLLANENMPRFHTQNIDFLNG